LIPGAAGVEGLEDLRRRDEERVLPGERVKGNVHDGADDAVGGDVVEGAARRLAQLHGAGRVTDVGNRRLVGAELRAAVGDGGHRAGERQRLRATLDLRERVAAVGRFVEV